MNCRQRRSLRRPSLPRCLCSRARNSHNKVQVRPLRVVLSRVKESDVGAAAGVGEVGRCGPLRGPHAQGRVRGRDLHRDRGADNGVGGRAHRPPRLTAQNIPPTIRAMSMGRVGAYALRFSWSDNHDTGLYTFNVLRHELCECEECVRSRSA